MTYDPGKLSLVTQGIARHRYWDYEDTGGETAGGYAANGFFTDAGDKGAEVGDRILIRDLANTIQYEARFSVIQDTGATQGTVVFDTG